MVKTYYFGAIRTHIGCAMRELGVTIAKAKRSAKMRISACDSSKTMGELAAALEDVFYFTAGLRNAGDGQR